MPLKPPPSKVILVGPMGVGKTTIGKQLALELSYTFLDTDREIEARSGADIPWIFDVEGEEGFRQREIKALADIVEREHIVLATGGGIIVKSENRRVLNTCAAVVYLTAGLDLLIARTSKDKKRPLLQNDNPRLALENILTVREPLYREVASYTVNTEGKSPRQVAKNIVALLSAG